MGSLLKKYGWTEWLCKSNFSFLCGASHPHELLERAAKLGYYGLNLCDYDGVYGLARSYRAAQRLKKERDEASGDVGRQSSSSQHIPNITRGEGSSGSIGSGHGVDAIENMSTRGNVDSSDSSLPHLFYGAELHLADHYDYPLVMQDSLAFVVLNQKGYAELCRLITFSHRRGKTKPWLSLEELLTFPLTNLVAIQPMRGLLRQGQDKRDKTAAMQKKIALLREAMPGRFYMALSRWGHPGEDYLGKVVWELSRTWDIPTLASFDVFFHHPQEKYTADVLAALRRQSHIGGAQAELFANDQRSMLPLVNIARRFHGVPDFDGMLKRSRALAEACQFSLGELRYYYPKEHLPPGISSQTYLESLVTDGYRQYFCEDPGNRMLALLQKELELIKHLNFADYFLTVWDIVSWARRQGILCQGRGSAANSAVCFVLGITGVNPQEFDLLFERFISVERGDPPDIDVDFEHERREEVIQYIYERYGRACAAMVANVITFRTRGALRFAARALGIHDDVIDVVSQLSSSRHHRSQGMVGILAGAKQQILASKTFPRLCAQVLPWDLWLRVAQRLHGFPRHLGIHSGGFILADRPLDELVPQEPATMEGRSVIQWSKDDIEALGFFKIDILALGILSAIRKCFSLVQTHYKQNLSLADIPRDDIKTYEMIQKADTVGVFQIESRAQMSMLPRLKPRCFYDLVIQVAIIRPGPIQGKMVHPFLRRREGLEPVTFPDPRLEPILKRTLGVPIFQEQVMRIAMILGGFTGGEANTLRRYLGVFSIASDDLNPLLIKLEKAMIKQGVHRDYIHSLLSQIREGFAHYGFPESHAASFGFLAYVSAYLKAHYPAVFFTSVLNSLPMGFYPTHVLLSTAMRCGVKVLPVCILKSDWDACLESVDSQDEACFAIRIGFRSIMDLPQEEMRLFVKRREVQQHFSLDSAIFFRTCGLSRGVLIQLAAADAFHGFGLKRREALWAAEAAPYRGILPETERQEHFALESSQEAIREDFAMTGTTLREHPCLVMRREGWHYPVAVQRITLAKNLNSCLSGARVFIFGMVIVKQAPPTAKGVVFITLEDETGFINLLLPPRLYERYHEVIRRENFLCAAGNIEHSGYSHIIKVYKFIDVQVRPAAVFDWDQNQQANAQSVGIKDKELVPVRQFY